MTAATTDRTAAWRLRPRTRNRVLVVHVLTAGAWIGIDVVMAVLVFTAVLTDDDRLKALSYQALDLFVVWTLLAMGLISLASGVLLGLGTKYGLVRYWWVAIKLGLNILLAGLVLIALAPEVSDAADRGEAFDAGQAASLEVGDDLPADRVTARPAHRRAAGRLQAVGADSQAVRRGVSKR